MNNIWITRHRTGDHSSPTIKGHANLKISILRLPIVVIVKKEKLDRIEKGIRFNLPIIIEAVAGNHHFIDRFIKDGEAIIGKAGGPLAKQTNPNGELALLIVGWMGKHMGMSWWKDI